MDDILVSKGEGDRKAGRQAEGMGTLTLPAYVNLQEDCKDLRYAFKGMMPPNPILICLLFFPETILCAFSFVEVRSLSHSIPVASGAVVRICSEKLENGIQHWELNAVCGDDMSGLGCNEKRVIEILGRRTQAQRMEIAQAYLTVYGESLHKRLKASFNGKLEVSLMHSSCRKLHRSLVYGNPGELTISIIAMTSL